MRSWSYQTIVGTLICAVPLVAHGAEPSALASLRVPPGFTVELVAEAPLVRHPVMAGFDDRGRLFVADNAGLNLPADELLKQLPNLIRMLEDTDGDGRFDRSTVFADKMTFPQGALWYRGAVYVASPPSIWRLEDTDGDGRADRREQIVNAFGFDGNAADIHGCFITPTGRIAWCDGRHGHDIAAAATQKPSKGLAARVFTCKPDGSDVEVFCGGGMDNPVEVAFTPRGDTIGTMTFYNPDNDRHDALVHFVHGGVYPRKHPCTSEFKRTGELMPALSRFGVVAPSGLARYEGSAWGDEYRDNLFSTQFNTHKIVRHVLTDRGGTYDCTNQDFLVSTSIDFHPTDVLADADGSLLVVDTGGWFRIGCPTSQIAKPEIGGAIYRIRRADAKPATDPRGLAFDWATISDTEMADLLGDQRPAVAQRAIETLAQRGDAAMGSLATALFESEDITCRQNGVWTLARIGTDNALRLLRQALADDDAPVRQAAVHAVSDLRDAESIYFLIDLLSHDDDPGVKREAATALGRLGRSEAVPAILSALSQPLDRFQEHAMIYALIEINAPAAVLPALSHAQPQVQRAALIALDQMGQQALKRETVAPLLATTDANLLRTVTEILGRRGAWADELVGTVGTWLAEPNPSEERLAIVRGALVALIDRPAIQARMAAALVDPATAGPMRLLLLEVIATNELARPTTAWNDAIRTCLSSDDRDLVYQAIAAASAVDATALADSLRAVGNNVTQPAALRLIALRAAAKAHAELNDATFTFLTGQLARKDALRDRLLAAEALGDSALSEEQVARVAGLLNECGPLEFSALAPALKSAHGVAAGLALVESLKTAPALASLSGARIKELIQNYPAEVQSAAQSLLARVEPDDATRTATLSALSKTLDGGDPLQGEAVFFGARAACSACHRVAGRGEKIGPELSTIGEVRSRRDLLEAIVFPSASLARGYETLTLTTHDGRVFNGLMSRETAATVFLRTTDRSEVRIARTDVEQAVPSRISIMPQGMDKLLSPAELRDLLAYLATLK